MKYDIAALKRKMLVKYPFFGSVVASVDYKENKDIPTAGTDGETIYYNPEYLEKLSIDEQTFIFAHEVCHIAFNHILRSDGKDPELWNIATDGVINQFLKRDGLKMAPGGVDMAEAINYDAEQLYEKLLQEKQQGQQSEQDNNSKQKQQGNQQQSSGSSQDGNNQQQSQSQQQGNSGSGSSQEQEKQSQEQSSGESEKYSQKEDKSKQDVGPDTHSMWEQAVEKHKEQQSSGSSQGGNNQQQPQSQQENGKAQNEEQNQESKQQSSNEGQSGDNQQQSQSQQQGNSGSGSSQKQEKQSQEQSGGESGKDSQKEDKSKQDVGHDTHSMWEQAVKKHKDQQEKNDKKESSLDKLLGKDKDKRDKEKTGLEKKQEELESMGEKDAFKKNFEDKKKQLEELKEAILKQASQAGTSTNRDIRTVNDIGTAKPLIDWRYVLREAIKYDVDWSYKNATLEDGVVSANLEEQPMPETEIVLDTSGSINTVLLKNFLRECKNILQHTKLKVGCFDTEFYGFHDIRTEEDIEKMRFEGGGGTDFNVAVGAFSRRVENKIIFTDGEAPMPYMPLDAIWIVFGGKKINPKGGKVIHIDNEKLERLYNYQMTNETKGRSR